MLGFLNRYRSPRRARLGVALVFFLTGFVFATWASRIPAVKAGLDLSNAQLSVALWGLNAGALTGLPLGAALVPRIGSRRALAVAFPAYSSALAAVAVSPTLAALTALLLASAFTNSVVDVAMNAHGVAVERRYGRPILSGLHAMFSLGGLVGAAVGAAAAALAVGVVPHFFAVAALAALAGTTASRLLLPSATDMATRTNAAPGPRPGRIRRNGSRGWSARLVGLGVLAFCVTLAEGSGNDWAAVYLSDALGTGPAVAALGFASFMAAMTLGRFAGDRLSARLGPARAFGAGTLAGGIGFGAALLVGSPLAGVLGFVLLGAGVSYTLPVLFSTAGKLGGHVATAVARVSMLGYLGAFTGPPLIGQLADRTSLPTALALPAALMACAALGARAVAQATAREPMRPANR